MAPETRNASKRAADLGAREDIVPAVAEREEVRRHAPVLILFLSPVVDQFLGESARAFAHATIGTKFRCGIGRHVFRERSGARTSVPIDL